jgi:hypothetical protein
MNGAASAAGLFFDAPFLFGEIFMFEHHGGRV